MDIKHRRDPQIRPLWKSWQHCLAIAFISGCSTSETAPTDLASARPADLSTSPPVDAAASDIALPLPDLTSTMGMDLGAAHDLAGGGNQGANSSVACGNASCVAPDSVCCRNSPYGAGACIKPAGACGSMSFYCDNNADCNGGDVCCYTDGKGSTCTPAANCAASMGRRMCLAKSDCQANENCCGAGPSPSWYCSSNLCPISRREYKTEIEYLDDDARARLSDELLKYRLSTYRYKAQGDAAPRHLGFIIDDVEPSQSIDPSGNAVDLYGYLSMTVATVQVQARQIAALEADIKALKRRLAGPRRR